MKAEGKRSILILLMVFFALSALSAFSLTPLDVDFTASGSGAVRFYTITNESDSPIAVVVNVAKRDFDLSGNETLSDGNRYFSIFPSKMIVNPDTSQLVRVEYKGPKILTKELSFFITFEQIFYSLGASQEEKERLFKYLVVYTTTSFVAPDKIIEKVSSSASFTEDGRIEITIKNQGNVHQELNSLKIRLVGDNGGSYQLSEDELEGVKEKIILPNVDKKISIDIPESLKESNKISSVMEYDYKYELL